MKIITFILFLISYNLCFAQITFQKTYNDGYGYCIHQTSDSGYIVIGTIYPGTIGNGIDICLIKTDQNGDTLWTRTFGFGDRDVANSGLTTSDGGYIIAGESDSIGSCLIKTDSNGNIEWVKKLTSYIFYESSIQKTTDGCYIITGYHPSHLGLSLLKIDSLGEVLWLKEYGIMGENQSGNCVCQTSDNGFIIAGTSDYGHSGITNIFIVKTDSLGDTLWTRRMSESGYDKASFVLQSFDGNYIITGTTSNDFNNTSKIFLMKLNSAGDTVWTKTFSVTDSEIGGSIKQTNDSGFIISGITWQPSFSTTDIYLVKTNSTGDTLWTKSYGGNDFDVASSIEQTYDGGYIISGTSQSFDTSGTYTYLVKTDANGNTGCNEHNTITIVGSYNVSQNNLSTYLSSITDSSVSTNAIVGHCGTATDVCNTVGINSVINNQNSEIVITPNPTSGKFKIKIDTPTSKLKIKSIELFNILGEKVYAFSLEYQSDLSSSEFEMNSDISFLKSGIYFLQLNGEKMYRKKLIKIQ